mgnify:CR=1 FL=1
MFFFFQAEDGIRDLVRSRGLGDVYKRQPFVPVVPLKRVSVTVVPAQTVVAGEAVTLVAAMSVSYTHLDAADERSSVDLGGRRIIKKKKNTDNASSEMHKRKK